MFERKMSRTERLAAWLVEARQRRLSGKVIHPVIFPDRSDYYPITFRYGVKSARYAAGYHTGEDHSCPIGSLCQSVSWGEVIHVGDGGLPGGWGPAYGNQVIIRTRNVRFDYAFCHLSSWSVQVGQKVVPGLIVGESGVSGNVTGPHVHFEARRAGGHYGDDVHPIRVKRMVVEVP